MAVAVTATRTIVPDLLDGKNYEDWNIYMKNYLMGQHLWSIVEHGIPSTAHLVSPLDKAKNAAALHAIHITCSPLIFAKIKSMGSAKEAWVELARMHREHQRNIRSTTNTVAAGDETELREGMIKGDWYAVNTFLRKYPLNTLLSEGTKGTVLHFAITLGQDKIAEKLIEMMSATDLEIKDSGGATVLHLAACRNRISLAKCLVQKHPELLTISGPGGFIPGTMSSSYGHEEMTRYLYSVIPETMSSSYGFDLLCKFISNKMFEISLDLLQSSPNLAVNNRTNGKLLSPIFQLSIQPSAFYSGCRLLFWQRWIYHLIKVQLPNNTQSHDTTEKLGVEGIKKFYDLKLSHLYALRILRCMCNYIATLSYGQQCNYGIPAAAFEATKRGTYEFLIELCKVVPTLFTCRDSANKKCCFIYAIEYRQEKVFNLFYEMSEIRKVDCVTIKDKDLNNILHAVGQLAPAFQLSRISGAALQMQRELQWFKEVEKITPTSYREAKNRDGLTPREVFTECHKELLKEGEKWMKDTAQSFIIVGTLIVTIMFAVAFTIPGGNDQNTGFPIFLGKKSFKIFLMSDAISFFAASTSILMFLGILTTRYAEDDFLVSLPTKLIIGLSSLFISTAAMMVSFSTTLVIMLQGQWWAIIPILLMAGIPVTLFVWLQFPLLVRIFMSTYGQGIFGKKVKIHPQ